MVGITIAALEAGPSTLNARARKTRGPALEVKELVRSEKVRTGARVRVADGSRVPRLLGAEGTVERIHKTSERTVLHVRLDDGLWQLLWPEELEPVVGEEQKRGDSGGSYSGLQNE